MPRGAGPISTPENWKSMDREQRHLFVVFNCSWVGTLSATLCRRMERRSEGISSLRSSPMMPPPRPRAPHTAAPPLTARAAAPCALCAPRRPLYAYARGHSAARARRAALPRLAARPRRRCRLPRFARARARARLRAPRRRAARAPPIRSAWHRGLGHRPLALAPVRLEGRHVVGEDDAVSIQNQAAARGIGSGPNAIALR